MRRHVSCREKQATLPPPLKSFPFTEILMALLVASSIPFGLAVGWEWLLKRVSDSRGDRTISRSGSRWRNRLVADPNRY